LPPGTPAAAVEAALAAAEACGVAPVDAPPELGEAEPLDALVAALVDADAAVLADDVAVLSLDEPPQAASNAAPAVAVDTSKKRRRFMNVIDLIPAVSSIVFLLIEPRGPPNPVARKELVNTVEGHVLPITPPRSWRANSPCYRTRS
jgi:hypothetical protein